MKIEKSDNKINKNDNITFFLQNRMSSPSNLAFEEKNQNVVGIIIFKNLIYEKKNFTSSSSFHFENKNGPLRKRKDRKSL